MGTRLVLILYSILTVFVRSTVGSNILRFQCIVNGMYSCIHMIVNSAMQYDTVYLNPLRETSMYMYNVYSPKTHALFTGVM